MNDLFPFLVIPLVLALAIGSIVWHYRRSNAVLQQWAEENGYRILSQEYRTFFRGPFFWTTSKGQTVYRVTVEDEDGYERSGWVRCGGWFLGLWSSKAQVRWDDE